MTPVSTGKGIVAVSVAGVSNGSFPVPSKGITDWKWEHIWSVYSLWAMALLPIGLALLFSHGTIPKELARNPGLAMKVASFGALWGIGSLLFGVSLARLGIAITNALINGMVAFLGSLGPVLAGSIQVDSQKLFWLISGLTLLVLSLVACSAASVTRDHANHLSAYESASSSRSVGAVLIAVVAGVMSSMLNFAFVYGTPLSQAAKAAGCSGYLASVAIWVPALFGGLVFNLGYPAYLIFSKGSWLAFFNRGNTAALWIRSSSMGVLWFGAILLYGIGASLMGDAGAVYGWALIIAVSILASNGWGAVTGEWRGTGVKPKVLMLASTVLLMLSLLLLAVNS
jgi:L-rhamnose-H+ transport protein